MTATTVATTQPKFSTANTEGVNIGQTYQVPETYYPQNNNPPFDLGTELFISDGGIALFCSITAAGNQWDFVAIDNNFKAAALTTTNGTGGVRIGVCPVAPVAPATGQTSYMWIITQGTGIKGQAAAATTSGVALYTTTTAGMASSLTTVGTQIAGIATYTSVTASGAVEILAATPMRLASF